ncbi:glycosyltransferase family 87 protein [Lamprobacter modestohalophilus]|uniref:glycosyltransferase family 87 protein n=1 Tax=Lamprobacter modestohalophilus TaxID=1064514 RepID=UPI002ADEBBD5|nr:glycosyltransferase family 87 protein [Lamprobacter modestohalophilus]MEA1048736.1 glycosyltransferase family 87 protein [Lamprobacter modestohalophilus]
MKRGTQELKLRSAPGPVRESAQGSSHGFWLGLSLAIILLGLMATQIELRDTDIAVYATAAERVFVHGEDPYPRRPGDVLPFTYPPTALPLLYPIVGLSLEQLGRLMLGLNLLLTVVVMIVIVGDLARDDPSSKLRFWGPIYIACFGGLYLNLQFGQVNLLLLLLIWGYWRAVRRSRDLEGAGAGTGSGSGSGSGLGSGSGAGAGAGAGAWLALGCIAKPHYVLLGLGTGPLPRPRLIIGGLAAGSLLIALSLWIAPSGSWVSWWQDIVATTSLTNLPPGHSSIAAPWNRSLAGAIARFLVPNKFSSIIADDPALAARLTGSAILIIIAATGAVLWRSMRRSLASRLEPRHSAPQPAPQSAPPKVAAGAASRSIQTGASRHNSHWAQPRGAIDHDIELSLISIAVFLISPASWTHHLVILLPAALVLLRDRVLAPGLAPSSRFAAGLVLAVLALTLDDLIPREIRVSSLPLMSLMTVAVIALWLLLAEQLWQRSGLGCLPRPNQQPSIDTEHEDNAVCGTNASTGTTTSTAPSRANSW